MASKCRLFSYSMNINVEEGVDEVESERVTARFSFALKSVIFMIILIDTRCHFLSLQAKIPYF